jgi:hypothetical protein
VTFAALLLAVAAPTHAAEAERAFAAMAQRSGQWTAFRAFAAPDAIMMAPEKVNAQAFLAPLKDPPRAVMWWPARAITSCDGTLAISTGPWIRDGGKATGTFTTVWQRQPDGGWKWLLDHGRDTPRAVAAGNRVKVRAPRCGAPVNAMFVPDPPASPTRLSALTGNASNLLVQVNSRMPTERSDIDLKLPPGRYLTGGGSNDGTLTWELDALDGPEKGAHLFRVWQSGKLVLLEVSGVPVS